MSLLLVNFIQALFQSTIVTLPDSDSAINSSRSAIFLLFISSSVQDSQSEVSSISLLLPSRINVALEFLLALATPIIEAAVTPEPPPLTTHRSSSCRGWMSSTKSSAKQTIVHLRSSLSIPISTSPPALNMSFSINLAAACASMSNSGCRSNALHLMFSLSNA